MRVLRQTPLAWKQVQVRRSRIQQQHWNPACQAPHLLITGLSSQFQLQLLHQLPPQPLPTSLHVHRHWKQSSKQSSSLQRPHLQHRRWQGYPMRTPLLVPCHRLAICLLSGGASRGRARPVGLEGGRRGRRGPCTSPPARGADPGISQAWSSSSWSPRTKQTCPSRPVFPLAVAFRGGVQPAARLRLQSLPVASAHKAMSRGMPRAGYCLPALLNLQSHLGRGL